MSRRKFARATDDWTAAANAGINDSDDPVSIVLTSSGATGLVVPAYVSWDSEILRVTAVAVDTPSGGLDTLTADRAQLGTSIASHTTANALVMNYMAEHINELQRSLGAAEMFITDMMGGDDVTTQLLVSQNILSSTKLKVVAQGSPDMTVVFSLGSGLCLGTLVRNLADTDSDTFVAPVGNPRIDIIQIDQQSVISAKIGTEAGSPSAPSPDSNNVVLAEMDHRVGEFSLKDTDDASNGFITDKRISR